MVYYTCTYLLYKIEYLFRNKILKPEYRKFRYHILMMIKYDFGEEKVPELNSNKMEKLCEKILECAYDNVKFHDEVEKMINIIDKYIISPNDTEPTKSVNFVENLKREFEQFIA